MKALLLAIFLTGCASAPDNSPSYWSGISTFAGHPHYFHHERHFHG
jgi:hypothetical protein